MKVRVKQITSLVMILTPFIIWKIMIKLLTKLYFMWLGRNEMEVPIKTEWITRNEN